MLGVAIALVIVMAVGFYARSQRDRAAEIIETGASTEGVSISCADTKDRFTHDNRCFPTWRYEVDGRRYEFEDRLHTFDRDEEEEIGRHATIHYDRAHPDQAARGELLD